MSIVAVTGDCCTTTTVALAAAWPVDDDVLLVEGDRTGGDVAAWFDLTETPSLSTAVTQVPDGSWPEIEHLTRLAPNGLRTLPAPARVVEAQQAVGEAGRSLVPTLATLRSPVTIADVGALTDAATNPFGQSTSVTIAVHRQASQSPGAAAVRLRRFADALEQLEAKRVGAGTLIAAVIGSTPFDLTEIEGFLADAVGVHTIIGLPVDELAAAVLAGRRGVSERRLGRLPLLRAARHLASAANHALADTTNGHWRAAR